jgi:hypothetical protein
VPRTVRPRYRISTTVLTTCPCSPPDAPGAVLSCSLAAVAGLTITALSHVSLVIGLGSSCSHPLLAKRPSRTAGSFLKTISRPPPAGAGLWSCAAGLTVTVLAGNAVPGITPSCSQRRQADSNSGVIAVAPAVRPPSGTTGAGAGGAPFAVPTLARTPAFVVSTFRRTASGGASEPPRLQNSRTMS